MSRSIPLGSRFPAAHQFLRLCLVDEIFPIPAAVTCQAEETEPDRWLVGLIWEAIDFTAAGTFSGEELRRIYGVWSSWAREQASEIAGLLPV